MRFLGRKEELSRLGQLVERPSGGPRGDLRKTAYRQVPLARGMVPASLRPVFRSRSIDFWHPASLLGYRCRGPDPRIRRCRVPGLARAARTLGARSPSPRVARTGHRRRTSLPGERCSGTSECVPALARSRCRRRKTCGGSRRIESADDARTRPGRRSAPVWARSRGHGVGAAARVVFSRSLRLSSAHGCESSCTQRGAGSRGIGSWHAKSQAGR